VVVLRNFEIVMGINSALFNPSELSKKYGDTLVDVVTQDPTTTLMKST
jgi:hypothetical protein